MITLQYVNDLAIACADDFLKTGHLKFTDLMKRVLSKNEEFQRVFSLEFNNRVGKPLLSFEDGPV
jgi:hypothetical protein